MYKLCNTGSISLTGSDSGPLTGSKPYGLWDWSYHALYIASKLHCMIVANVTTSTHKWLMNKTDRETGNNKPVTHCNT